MYSWALSEKLCRPCCIEKFAIIIIMHTIIKCDFLCLEKAFQYLWSLQISTMLTLHQVSSRLKCAAKVSASQNFFFRWEDKLPKFSHSCTVKCAWPWVKLVPAPNPACLPSWNDFQGVGALVCPLKYQGIGEERVLLREIRMWLVWNSATV